jgi:N-acetylglucosaminyl-diphospho-decaprenol L-rhamnosyltransferase
MTYSIEPAVTMRIEGDPEHVEQHGATPAGDRLPTALAVVILNYRTASLTIACLDSLAPQMSSDIDVIVVDNASHDGSAEAIERAIVERDYSEWARVVRSPINGGFAAGNNVGIRAVRAEAYMLLNSDTKVGEGAIAAFRRILDERPDAALIGPKLVGENGETQVSTFRLPTPEGELVRASRTGVLRKLLRTQDIPFPVGNEPAEPEWIAFACVVIRREVFDRIGMLDEGYFMYFEDIDYCRRAREAGFKILYSPEPRIVHIAGGSSHVTSASENRERARRPRYFYEARSRYYAKFFGQRGLLRANAMFTVGRSVALAREVLGRTPHLRRLESVDIWMNSLRPFKPSRSRPRPPDQLPRGDQNINPEGIGVLDLLREDFATHDRDLLEPGFWAVAMHRFGNWRMDVRPKALRAPLSVVYKVGFTSINWFWGIDLGYTVKLGRRVRLWHHGGMVLTAKSIGDDVVIRHNTTLGIARTHDITKRPTIGDRVDIGTGACILGDVVIGHDSVVGANAVVTKSFPPNATLVGIPARNVSPPSSDDTAASDAGGPDSQWRRSAR